MAKSDRDKKTLPTKAQHACLMAIMKLDGRMDGAGLAPMPVLFVVDCYFERANNALQEMKKQGFLAFDVESGSYRVCDENIPSRTDYLIGAPPRHPLTDDELDNIAAWLKAGVSGLAPSHRDAPPGAPAIARRNAKPPPPPEPEPEPQAVEPVPAPPPAPPVAPPAPPEITTWQVLLHLANLAVIIDLNGGSLAIPFAGDFFRDEIENEAERQAVVKLARDQDWYACGEHVARVTDNGRAQIRLNGIIPELELRDATAFLAKRGIFPNAKQSVPPAIASPPPSDDPAPVPEEPMGAAVTREDPTEEPEPTVASTAGSAQRREISDSKRLKKANSFAARIVAMHAHVEDRFGHKLPGKLSDSVVERVSTAGKSTRNNLSAWGLMESEQRGWRQFDWSTTRHGRDEIKRLKVQSELSDAEADALIAPFRGAQTDAPAAPSLSAEHRQRLDELRARIAAYDNDIQQVETTLALLREERAALEQELSAIDASSASCTVH